MKDNNDTFNSQEIRKYLLEKRNQLLEQENLDLDDKFINASFVKLTNLGKTTEDTKKIIDNVILEIQNLKNYLSEKLANLSLEEIYIRDENFINEIMQGFVYNFRTPVGAKKEIDVIVDFLQEVNKLKKKNNALDYTIEEIKLLCNQFTIAKREKDVTKIDMLTFLQGTAFFQSLKMEDPEFSQTYDNYLFKLAKLFNDMQLEYFRNDKRLNKSELPLAFFQKFLTKAQTLYDSDMQKVEYYKDSNPNSVMNLYNVGGIRNIDDVKNFASVFEKYKHYYLEKIAFERSKIFTSLFDMKLLAQQILNSDKETLKELEAISSRFATKQMYPLQTKISFETLKEMTIDFFNSVNPQFASIVQKAVNGDIDIKYGNNPMVNCVELGTATTAVLTNFGDLRDLYSIVHEFTHYLDFTLGQNVTRSVFTETNAQCMERCLDSYLLNLNPEKVREYEIDAKVLKADVANRIVSTFFTRFNCVKEVATRSMANETPNLAKDNTYVLSQLYSTVFSKLSRDEQIVRINAMVNVTRNNDLTTYLKLIPCDLTRQNLNRSNIVADSLQQVWTTYQQRELEAKHSEDNQDLENSLSKPDKQNLFGEQRDKRIKAQSHFDTMSLQDRETFAKMQEEAKKLKLVANKDMPIRLTLAKKDKENTSNDSTSNGFISILLLSLSTAFISEMVAMATYLLIKR